ncbi:hypothetical protein ACMAUO_19300 [Gluconacetobacter sp. Hr-1-5]|uniref:hypothetical protein n=1 Tax=Gluconacetobacter sp. Hr-1-5 TaxID=3395370 RepID=UPI003B52B610
MDIKIDELGEIHFRRPGMIVREVKAGDIDREALRATSIAEAHAATEAFPRHLERIRDILQACFPPHVLATISSWSVTHKVGPDGVAVDGLLAGLEQHHVELLQAILLRMDRWEWGVERASYQQIGEVTGELKALAIAFQRRRALEVDKVSSDPQNLAVALIQERLRDQTQMIRNWGRYDEMVRIVRELHAPLDDEFRSYHGFGATELVDVASGLVNLIQQRLSDRQTLLDGIMRGRTRKAIVHAYFERYDGVDGDPEEFLASLPPKTTLRQLRMMLHEYASTGLMLEFLVDPGDLAARIGISTQVVESVFAAIGLVPGVLRAKEPEHLFLDNPVWKRPAIKDGAEFLLFIPQTIVGFLPDLLRELAAEMGLEKRLERRRGRYLENETARLISVALPTARMLPGVKWSWKGVPYETDVIAVVDKVVVIAEAKSAVLTDAALRGAVNSARRHVKNLLVEPAIQSARLQDILRAASEGDAEAVAVATSLGLGIDAADIKQTIRLSVTLDDFATLASAQAELKYAGWFPDELVQPATMTLADLGTCTDILDRPLFFLHYLIGRERIQRVASVFGDELDYLGTYLNSGLDLAEVAAGTHKGIFSRMSMAIDAYHLALGMERDAAKPGPRVPPYVAAVLEKLEVGQQPGWTTTGLTLLDAVPPGTGCGVGDALEKLAAEVEDGGNGPERPGVLLACADSRRAVAAFHVFAARDRDEVPERLRFLGQYAMEMTETDRCVIFARMLERWDQPFSITGWVEAEESDA